MPKSNLSRRGGMKKIHNIYLDFAASVSPNPSSIHREGVYAKNKLEEMRKIVALVLDSHRDEVIFTSGGTESNNLAIQGVLYAAQEQDFFRSSVSHVPIPARPFKNLTPVPHIVTTNIEHPSVLETCKLLEKRKLAQISIVPVEANGIVDPKKIKKEIKNNTVLVSVMYANNEIGTIQPIKEIAKEIRHHRKMNATILPFFHTDAVQAVNYLDLNVERLGVDLLSLSGTKIEDSGRVGMLYKRRTVNIESLFGGGDQEGGLRPGTENLKEIEKFSVALEKVQKIKDKEVKRLGELRDYFIKAVAELKAITNGDLKDRLPNNVNITFPKIPSDLLVIELSAKGVMASSKSACESSKAEGSYVIKALRPESNVEIGGLRFSFGRQTTKKDIVYTVKVLSEILTKLKKWYN